MTRAMPTAVAVLLAGCLCAPGALAEDPWADRVVDVQAVDPNPGFNAPEKTLGAPTGGGTFAPNNSGLHSVGRPPSYIVLAFDTPVTDDPDNPLGLDCIVFGNATWLGGNPQQKWVEPGLIEISEDVNGNGLTDDPWYVIPGSRDLDASVLPGGIAQPAPPLAGNIQNPNATDADPGNDDEEYDWGYVELTPTQTPCLDNYVRPDDPHEVGLTLGSGGGDAFDIAWAVDAAGQPANLSRFHFIRISALVEYYAGGFGWITPEIDAVADVAPDVDSDGDGILDEYESRVAATDPNRPENTVLALEIPPEDGGSPAGTELGIAADGAGNALRLYSNGQRLDPYRAYNGIVDIVEPPMPPETIPGLLKSGAVREFQCSVGDFQAAEIQNAEFTMVYSASDIAGLDEPGLQPYRYDGGAFTQEGISSVTRDLGENTVSFRSQYPGVFVLASTAGDGDTGEETSGFALTAQPGGTIIADPANTLTVTSEPLLSEGSVPVPDGTLFTVDATLGTITTADVDGVTPGIQVAVDGGIITFTLQAGTQAGVASLMASSLDGKLSGQGQATFTAGPPAAPAEINLLTPEAPAPGLVQFSTGILADKHGNPIEDGTTVTLVVDGGAPVGGDADPSAPGYQIACTNAIAVFWIQVHQTKEEVSVTVSLYADSGQTELLGAETFCFAYAEVPVQTPGLLAAVLALILGLAWRQLRRA